MAALRQVRGWFVAIALSAMVLGAPALLAPISAPSASADPIGDCNTQSGVIVVVDFSAFNGAVQRGCSAAGGSGLQVLQSSFNAQGTQQYKLLFICRISDGARYLPTPADQDCLNTPPGNAYWSYWHADPGQSTWSYSSTGAASSNPGPGSVDGWAFGDSNTRPAVSPDAVRASNPPPAPAPVDTPAPADPTPPPATQEAPAPAAPAPTAGQEAAGSTGGAGQGGGGSAGAGSAPAGGDASTTAASDAPTDAPTDASASASTSTTAANGESSSGSSGSPSIVNASSNEAAPHGGSGSALPTIITLLAVLVIAAGAGAVALRRRGRRASP